MGAYYGTDSQGRSTVTPFPPPHGKNPSVGQSPPRGEQSRPGCSLTPRASRLGEDTRAARCSWDLLKAPGRAPLGCPPGHGPTPPPGCPAATVVTGSTRGPQGQDWDQVRQGWEGRGPEGARTAHPPGIRLAVVLSGHDVLKQLPARDPAGRARRSQIPETPRPRHFHHCHQH